MSTLLEAAVVGDRPDLSDVPTAVLQAAMALVETWRGRLDVFQIEAGVELDRRGVDERVLARQLKAAKAPNPRQRAAVMSALPSLPAAGSAFADGKIGVSHLNELAKVQRKLPAEFAEREAEFAEKACTLTAFGLRKALVAFVNEHQPEKAVEFDGELGVELILRNDGRYDLRGVLDTISGQVLERALKNQKDLTWRAEHPERNPERVEQPPYRLQMLKALIALCEGGTRARSTLRSKYLLLLVVDYATYISGTHADTLATTADGVPLSIAQLRKLACDADIMPVIVGPDSIPINLGREARWFTEHQHLAALVMHPTCVMCDVPAEDCAMHHITPYPAGATDMANGIPLCAGCHDLVHALKLTIERSNGLVTVRRPDGTLYCERAFNTYTSPNNRELKLSA